VARVMTDNGSCYKSFDFRDACRELGLRHLRPKPYTPKTNGERFIQTALQSLHPLRRPQRRAPIRLHRYNWPHGRLKANTPISRLGLSEDNLLRLHK
jgi:transposase InsO family protein